MNRALVKRKPPSELSQNAISPRQSEVESKDSKSRSFPYLLSLISFIIFYVNLCPTVYFWDSAELITASETLGIPHPPGFPLYILFGSLLTLIPAGSIAYKINLLSAITGSITLFFLYRIIENLVNRLKLKRRYDLIGWQYYSFVSLLLFAVSYSSLTQALRAEVYYPNLLLICFIVYLVTKPVFSFAERNRNILLIAFLIGLGAGIHHLTVFLTIPGVFLIYASSKHSNFVKLLPFVVAALSAGLTIVLFIPIRFSANPPYFWGEASSVQGLIDIMTASDFSKNFNPFGIGHIKNLIGFNIDLLFRQLGVLGITGMLLGIFLAFKRIPLLGLGLLLILLLNLSSIFLFEEYFYTYLDLHGYLLLSMALTSVLSAIGLCYLINGIYRKKTVRAKMDYRHLLTVSLIIIALTGMATADIFSFSLRKYIGAEELSEKLSEKLDNNSVIICSSMNTKFLLDYKKHCSSELSEINVVDLNSLDRKWYRENIVPKLIQDPLTSDDSKSILNDIIRNHQENIFTDFSPSLSYNADHFVPDGLLYKYSPGHHRDKHKLMIDIFPQSDEDLELKRFYSEWLLNRGIYYYFTKNAIFSDSCFKVLINIDSESSDIIKNIKNSIMKTD
ncbi:MAG: DUF2723 domain-containing protein [candidate division Zixibacteria bacterium]|nr:DUF2723 domain-containing protein [candidate division Zixibacteria bacterium]